MVAAVLEILAIVFGFLGTMSMCIALYLRSHYP